MQRFGRESVTDLDAVHLVEYRAEDAVLHAATTTRV
jgi:hypothetical protein